MDSTKIISINGDSVYSLLTPLSKIIYESYLNVYKQLGIGHSEVIYQKALLIELNLKLSGVNGCSIDIERNLNVIYIDSIGNKHSVGTERIDLFIHNDILYNEGSIILELKAQPKHIQDKDIFQLKKYFRELKKENTPYGYGIVINFNQSYTTTDSHKYGDFVIVKDDSNNTSEESYDN